MIQRRGEVYDPEIACTIAASDSKMMNAVAGFLPNAGGKAKGIGYAEEQSPCLMTDNRPAVRTLQVRAGNNHINGKGGNGPLVQDDVTATLTTWDKQQSVFEEDMSIRYLTPTECERLQGFPDGYTEIEYRGKPAGDTQRYKALGNSMAVPVMAWIGERIRMVDGLEEA